MLGKEIEARSVFGMEIDHCNARYLVVSCPGCGIVSPCTIKWNLRSDVTGTLFYPKVYVGDQ